MGPIRQFLVAMAVFVVVLVGVSKSTRCVCDWTPFTSCKTELAADPVLQRRYASMRRTTPRSSKIC